jgi:hypothetical protein
MVYITTRALTPKCTELVLKAEPPTRKSNDAQPVHVCFARSHRRGFTLPKAGEKATAKVSCVEPDLTSWSGSRTRELRDARVWRTRRQRTLFSSFPERSTALATACLRRRFLA